MQEQWQAELNEIRAIVRDLTERLAYAEERGRQQDAALMLAIAQHPAHGVAPLPATRDRRRHLRLLHA